MTTAAPAEGGSGTVRAVLERHVAAGAVPGAVALVWHDGAESLCEVVGTTDPGGGRPLARDDLFRISSMTKLVTALAALLLAGGERSGRRLLSEASVAAVTSDRPTPAQKAHGGLGPTCFEGRGWGFCLAVTTEDVPGGRPSGSFGWDGGLGTVFWADPAHALVALLLTQAVWPSPAPPPVAVEFERAVYAALD